MPFMSPLRRSNLVIRRLALLVPILILIAVVQVLPQVDLPETAFHEDTAPVVVKSRALAVPVFTINDLNRAHDSLRFVAAFADERVALDQATQASTPLVLSILRC
jgi:hypothetical protein